MKKVLGMVICLMMLSSVVLASPLTDYSQGKGSIDLTFRNTTNSGTANAPALGISIFGDASSKYNLDGAVTFGLGNNFAFQYRTFSPESKDTIIQNSGGVTDKTKYTTNEFNVLYKLDKNVAAFVGMVNAKGQMTFSDPTVNFTTSSKNLWQLGVVGSTSIGEKTTLWGSVAAGGSSLLNWEIGVGYEFAPNWEFNVNYREFKADDFTGTIGGVVPVSVTEAKAKGAGFGVTYKF